ncbi:MAG: TOTE conflict system archaeo-eukaryotic primase domain-containing protein, partial [Ignavibacteriaceae bacterium]
MSDDKKNNLTLLTKFQELLIENDKLKAENERLKGQLDILNRSKENLSEIKLPTGKADAEEENYSGTIIQSENISSVNQKSKPDEKVKIFMSLFKGREDVFAKRWQNKNGASGYSPVCLNEWKPGICSKPKIKCSECANKSFQILNEKVVDEHLRGNIIAGIYSMQLDETCYFLAIDFDDDGWEKDISLLRNVCKEFDIPFAVERSRSGNGAHAWFFFDEPISAALARKFGTSLLTYSMNKRHEIKFKSYDRFFPNQDTMPKGGFGNLIALPLQ